MAKLKLDHDVDLYVARSTYTDEDRAAISEAIAKNRQSPDYAKPVAALKKTVERIERIKAGKSVGRKKKKKKAG